jgi:DNA modification methylase
MAEQTQNLIRNRIVGSGEKPASQFQANAANWRVHPKAQQEALDAVLDTVGWVGRVLENQRTGNLIDGHLRIMQALKRGDETPVPFDLVDLDPAEEALVLASIDPIAAMATADKEKLSDLLNSIQSEDQSVADLLQSIAKENRVKIASDAGGGNSDPDEIPEQRAATNIKAGDLFQLGRHRLLCGDSTSADAVAALMGDARADCVFTSPPYGVGIDYGTYQDTIENLRSMLPLLAERWLSIVAPGGFAVINFGDIVSGRAAANVDDVCEYPMAVEYWPVFRSAGWFLWSRRVWCKPNARVHSPWAIQSNRAASDWEHVWTWKAPGDAILARINGEYQSANGWFDTTRESGVDVGKESHGAGMAVALPLRMLNVHSRAGAVVYEPFTGTGTTMIACEQSDRRCFGMEIEPLYVQMAIDRWEAFTGQHAEFLGNVIDGSGPS